MNLNTISFAFLLGKKANKIQEELGTVIAPPWKRKRGKTKKCFGPV
jgi:hypothetical protein